MKAKHSVMMAGVAGLTAMTIAASATAQSTGFTALDARITALEEADTNRPNLSFGVAGVELTIYGYVKADLIYDLDTDLGTTAFGLGAISPGGGTGSHFRGQAIQSRIGVRAKIPTSFGYATARIEGDFFGGGGGTFRLRHADVNIGGLTFGQTWTNFMPIESYPSSLDFQGPAGIPFARVTQARYTHAFDGGLGASVSVEQSAGSSSEPALTAALTYSGERTFLKLAALRTRVASPSGDIDGFGVNLSGNAQLWEGGMLNASYTMGDAISSYMVFGGADTFDPGAGDVAVESEGLTVGVSQSMGDAWTFGIAYGLRENDIGALTDTERLQTIHLTANYSIAENTKIGLEYITGERDLFDGTSASADRIHAAVQFNF